MSDTHEKDAPVPLGYQLQELVDRYEDLRDDATAGAEAGDYDEYSETLDKLQGEENRKARLEFLAKVSGTDALAPDDHDKAYDRFNTRARELFGWVGGYRLGSVEDGVITLSTLEDDQTHGSFMDDTVLMAGPNPDGALFIVKFEVKKAQRSDPMDPNEAEVQITKDAIAKFGEVVTILENKEVSADSGETVS